MLIVDTNMKYKHQLVKIDKKKIVNNQLVI